MRSLKKIALYVLAIVGVMYGYQFITGKSIATLPREIVDKLQQKDTAKESSNPRYYRDPGRNLPNDMK